MTHEAIEIPLSKKKMIISLISSVLFIAVGIWILISPSEPSNRFFGNPSVIFTTGIICILFFGLTAIIAGKKLADKKAGLIINNQGILDNSSGVSAGLVLWSDIEDIKVSTVMSQKFILLIVKNPEVYLDRVKNPLQRNTMRINHKTYGSPISIASNSLQTNFDSLFKLIVEKRSAYTS